MSNGQQTNLPRAAVACERLVGDFRMMLLIRRFEEKVDELFRTGVIRGTSHLCAGQEAVAVGVCAAMQPTDYMTSTHRGHGHLLAKGADPARVMAELFGKATGYSRGRGGSQHAACIEKGFLGSNGITGGGIPIATGAALAVQMKKRGFAGDNRARPDAVVVCFLGDGASNIGMFHESLNMAAVWKLPVVYVCENNLYAMSVPIAESTAVTDIAFRASAYNMPGVIVDGCDYFAVVDAAAKAADCARAEAGPTLIEAKTYRYFGHSKSDGCEYRSQEEEAHWRQRDPIVLMQNRLTSMGLLHENTCAAIRAQVEQEIEAAVRFAQESPEPDFDPRDHKVWAA